MTSNALWRKFFISALAWVMTFSLVDSAVTDDLLFSASFRDISGDMNAQYFRLEDVNHNQIDRIREEIIAARRTINVDIPLSEYIPDIYTKGFIFTYGDGYRREYINIKPGWKNFRNVLEVSYPAYIASLQEARNELSTIRTTNGTCKSRSHTLEQNIRKWMLCRAAFMMQTRDMHRQELVAELFNGWFDGAYGAWVMSDGAFDFDYALLEYVEGNRSPELKATTTFRNRAARYRGDIQDVMAGEIRLYNTAENMANNGHFCQAADLVSSLKPRFIELSEKFDQSMINRISLDHFSDAIETWSNACSAPNDRESVSDDVAQNDRWR